MVLPAKSNFQNEVGKRTKANSGIIKEWPGIDTQESCKMCYNIYFISGDGNPLTILIKVI